MGGITLPGTASSRSGFTPGAGGGLGDSVHSVGEAGLILETAAVTLVFLAAAKDGTAGAPNLQLHDVKTGKCLKSFIQKKMQNW